MPSIRIEVPGHTFVAGLPPSAVRIGSAAECELRLGVAGVASVHCVIEPLADGRYRLRDLASGRGTVVNGIAAHQVALQPGDVVEVGSARLVFLADAAAAAPSAPAPRAASPAAPAPPPRAPAPRAAGARRLATALIAMGVLAVLAIAAALVLDSSEEASPRLAREMERGEDLLRGREWLAAREVFERIAADPEAGELAGKAGRYLERARAESADATRTLERIDRDWEEFDLGAVAVQRDLLSARHGPWFTREFDALVERIRTRQDAWALGRIEETRGEARAAAGAGRFADARLAWDRLRKASFRPDVRAAVDEGVRVLEADAKAAVAAVLEQAERARSEGGPEAEARSLRGSLERFASTAQETVLSARIARAEAEARRLAPVVSPAPAAPSTAPQAPPTPAPSEAAPPPSAEVVAKVEKALAEADAAAADRRFGAALSAIDGVVGSVPSGPLRARLDARRDDLALAKDALARIAADIRERPQKYRNVRLAAGVATSLVDADEDTVKGTLAGGHATHRWASLSAERMEAIVERLAPAPQDAVGAAALLREFGAREAAEASLFRAGEGGADRARVFALLARWRGEAVPEGGYVVHEKRYVTPQERERRILEAKITDALARVDAREPEDRKKAYRALLDLGEPARPRLVEALKGRRERLVRDLAADRSFTNQKTRLRLFDELQKRRAAAIALIRDEARYPYPSADHKGQADVDALVEKVREVWERPFDLVAQWDDGVKARLVEITEVDEAWASAEPRYRPDLDAIRSSASAAVDMPAVAPTSQAQGDREYSLKVLAFNERVATTSTEQERLNVLVVNEYRMMMGRVALRINERLVRSARGHSRWMARTGIFSHDNTQDPALKTPTQRARRQGYGSGVGENIAWGTSTGDEAFRAWYGSSGHHRNMLADGWYEMGAGRVVSEKGPYWTQNFGGGGKGLTEPEPLPAPAADVAPEAESETPAPPSGTPRVPDEPPPADEPDEPETPGGG